jgi:hypothetical protein
MAKADRLFPELKPGTSPRWYAYRFSNGSISLDPARAIAAKRAGQSVHLVRKTIRAARRLPRGPASRV